MKKTNKILSVFMALIMMLSIVSITAVAEEPLYSVGDIIEFGSYPQSEVKDETLLAELNAQTLEWISYGYYSGTIDEQVPGDFMKYADVTYNNNKYRAVTFTDYRPYATAYTSEYTCQEENGYYTDTVYWFIYEPIQWCILDPNEGFVLSETIIDSQAYHNTVCIEYDDYYQNSSCEKLACDYAASSIREWLNDAFYNTAFTSEEKAEVFNSVQENTSPFDSAYDGEATYDKIFLPSFDDVMNEEYGFVSHKLEDASRRAFGTDYAKCQGIAIEDSTIDKYSQWWLRAPEEYGCSGFIAGDGQYTPELFAPCWTCFGVRPAMKMNLNQDFDVKEIGERFYIVSPSRTEVRYKDGIVLHAEVEGNAPAGSYIRWYVYDYEMFTTHVLDNGYAFEIVSENKGDTFVEARLYDEDGNLLASDTIMMHSDAGLFQKFIGIFRVLFNKTTIYMY